MSEQLLPSEEEEAKIREDFIREQAALFNFYEVGVNAVERCRIRGGYRSVGAPLREIAPGDRATENRCLHTRRRIYW